jgi:PAS domain S-box-containing protein
LKEHSNIHVISFLRSAVKAASLVVAGVGLTVLMGWLLNISPLKNILPDAASMKFNTALCFLLCGTSLWFLQKEEIRQREKRIGQILAMATIVIGIFTLSEYIFNWELGIDQFFVQDPGTPLNEFPGRMSQITAIGFILGGFALILIGSIFSQFLSTSVGVLSLLALIGYLFDFRSLYQLPGYGSVALHTAVTFLVLSLAILAARPALGIMNLVASNQEGGRTLRLFLPSSILLTIFIGWLIHQGQRLGVVDSQNSEALLIISLVLIYSPLIFFHASRINQAERQVDRLNRLYATLSQVNQAIVHAKDRETLYRTVCEAVVHAGRFHLGWIGLLDAETGVIEPVAMKGTATEPLRSLKINVNDTPFSEGLLGLAVRSQMSVTSDDIQTDSRMKHWREESRKQGFRSAAAIPIRHRDEVIGVLSLYAGQPGFFQNEEEIRLLTEIGGDVSFALDTLEAENARSHLAAIIESSNDAIVTKDLDGIITSWNLGAEKVFGYTANEIIGQPILRLIPPDRVEEEEMILNQIKQDQLVGHFETVRQKKDGELMDVSITVSPVKDKNGTVIGASKIARDITERILAEERFRLAIESAPNAIVMVDREGRIVLINSRAENDFRYTREELMRKNVDALVPERFRENHVSFRAGFYEQPQLRPMGVGRELYGLRKDQTEFPVEIGLAPIKMKQGVLVMATIVDITERKRTEAELKHTVEDLKRSNADLEQFAYVASHDLQEPLRTITGMVQLLQKRYQGNLDARADEYIGFTVEAATRMQALINGLLEFSRVDRQGKPIEEVNMKDVVQAATKSLSKTIHEKNAIITCEDLPTVQVDSLQMARLFQNLIGNAIKFRSERQPKIHISATALEDKWHFSVRDNGIGIEPQYFERIFVIFQRLHTRTEYPGTGIGLSLCKKIVERHGGQIWVESESGAGTTFHFTIPKEVIK